MLKKLVISIVLLIGINFTIQSQDIEKINNFEKEFNNINKTGMIILGSWALINLISGTAGNFLSGGESKYFHQFNALWNTVNLGLAVNGYLSSSSYESTTSISTLLSGYNSIQNILLFNSGLDIAYIVTGFFLKEKAVNSKENSERLRGYGNSLIVQGSFLLVFDLVMYFVHLNNFNVNFLPLIDFAGNNALGFIIKL